MTISFPSPFDPLIHVRMEVRGDRTSSGRRVGTNKILRVGVSYIEYQAPTPYHFSNKNRCWHTICQNFLWCPSYLGSRNGHHLLIFVWSPFLQKKHILRCFSNTPFWKKFCKWANDLCVLNSTKKDVIQTKKNFDPLRSWDFTTPRGREFYRNRRYTHV